MPFRTSLSLSIIVIVCFLSACGSEIIEPEATPVPWQRTSFVSTRLSPGFALQFPATWRYQVLEAGIILSNDPDVLSAPNTAEIPSGALIMNVSLLTENQVRVIGARNAADLIDAFVASSSDDALTPKYRDTNAIKIEGRDGAQSFVSIAGSDSLLLTMNLEGNFALAVVVAPEGELKTHIEILNKIFASIELLNPE